VGEMRDQETAQIGMRAAMTGHLVLSTLHTNDATTAPVRLIDMGAPRFMVAMSLLGVLAQRLMRVVCESCTSTHTPSPSEVAWLAYELGEHVVNYQFASGKGCTHCNGTGYQGRIGVYELLEMNSELVEAANHHDTNYFIKHAREKMVGQTLRAQAVQLVVAKKTTIAEAMRISNEFED